MVHDGERLARRRRYFVSLGVAILAVCRLAPAQEAAPVAPVDLALPSSVYVKVQLEDKIKVPRLKTGDIIAGKLAQDIYSGDHELFPAGSVVHLTVDKLGRRKRVPNDHWPWVVKAFTPRDENYPLFRSATVTLADGRDVALQVSLINIQREREVRARTKTTTKNTPALGTTLTLEAATPAQIMRDSANAAIAGPVTLTAGTQAKIVLLAGLSASTSRPGESFRARLIEPVRLGAKLVLPEGTMLAGKVVSRTPPRMLSRAGSILFVFTDLTLPGQSAIPVSASVTAADLDRRSHTRIDAEGKLHGERPGKAWMAINLGVTAGVAKEADDTIQLIIEAVVSSATDASTAGVGRIVATCASGIFLLTRHGRDVILPRFTEMNVVFDRALTLPAPGSAGNL